MKGKDHLVAMFHANLSAEQRDEVLARAKKGTVRIMIGTVCIGLARQFISIDYLLSVLIIIFTLLRSYK